MFLYGTSYPHASAVGLPLCSSLTGGSLRRGSIRRKNAYENAMCESFFATLECELLDRSRFPTAAEADREIFRFIEGFYNTCRIHSACEFGSPLRGPRG